MNDLLIPPAGLPGTFHVVEATRRDYLAVARHHYRRRPPAVFCDALAVRHAATRTGAGRVVAVAVLAWPVAICRPRNRHFRVPPGYGNAVRFANANVRTVARVVVHPQFRAAGLARELVRRLIDRCPTRYVEASTTMGAFVGCFEAAGMTRFPAVAGEPTYFLVDRRG